MSSKPSAPTRTSDPGIVAIVVRELSQRFGSRLSTNSAVREQHGRGEALDPGLPPPDAVVWPESTAEISEIVRLCSAAGVPVIPFGAGTSLEGHVSAPLGGISVDLSRMNKILAVNAEDADCVVQPGVTREDLNAYLRDSGLYFPVDPGANATIGGMVSTRASGTTTVMYGAMTHNVLALEVVLPDGKIMRCGTRARKSSAGYDLVRLFTGAEGTLGIISEVTLRLRGYPEEIGAATCAFQTLRGAVDTVTELLQAGAPMARMEFLDEVQIRACNKHSQLDAGRAADAVPRIPRHGGERGRAGRARPGDCRRQWRQDLRLGDATGRPHAALEGAAQRLFRGARAASPPASRSSPTSACRSRRSPKPSRPRAPTSIARDCSRPSSATSATATST